MATARHKVHLGENGLRTSRKVSKTKVHKKPLGKLDGSLLVLLLIMLAFGLIMVFSAGYAWAIKDFGNSYYYLYNQGRVMLGGIVIMLGVSRLDYHWYRKFSWPLMVFATGLLVLVLFIGSGTGAKRWIYIGNQSFQPSEVMKFAVVLLFAHLIAKNYKKMDTIKYGTAPFICILGMIAALMMQQPHLSGTLLILSIGAVMMWVGGTNFIHFLVLGAGAIGALAGYVMYKGIDYMEARVYNWQHPLENALTDNWQTRQSLIAIGSGGLFGKGIGESQQKFMWLPEAHNDFIFSIVCEELGLIGGMMVIIMFMLLAFKGYSIAAKAPDKFGFMLAVGLSTHIVIQAILNIAVVTNTIPNTGISLPFFSYGGTALLMQLGEMGILLNISRQSVNRRRRVKR